MLRITAMFIAICMVLIAGSLGVILYLGLGLNGIASASVALAALLAMALYKVITAKENVGRDDTDRRIAEFSQVTAELRGRIADIDRRIEILEGRATTAETETREIDPLLIEIGELGGLLNQLAQTVAAHEAELHDRAKAIAVAADPALAAPRLENPDIAAMAAAPAPASPVTAANDSTAASGAAAPADTAAASGPARGMGRENIAAMIGEAIENNRIDLYLQPIVTLPQRKVRYYEALSRLRTNDGTVVPAADFIEDAESAGAMPKIDKLLVFRCVQVLRRLQLKNREIGLFCNLSPTMLLDSAYFREFLEFVEGNRELAPALMFEFTQKAYRSFSPLEHESLAALAERGFRFSLDHVTDLRITPKELADRAFRVIKVPAHLLLDRAADAGNDIHPADLGNLLARSGIDLIAERIESEATVVDLLDQDVRFGQGLLFSAPRPVRAEALQRSTEASAKPVPAAAAAAVVPARPRTAFVMRGEKIAAR